MKVKRVVLENYGAFYGVHEFQVENRGLVLVLGENRDEPRMNSNGSAKSTLLESIDWCLFGVVPKGTHADSVVNDEAKVCAVTTFLEDDDGTQGAIIRKRPAALSFVVGGENRAGLDTKETQQRIDEWLGMDRDVFHAAVFFGQEDLRRFADSTDAQRMEILSQIIPELREVDGLLEAAKHHRGEIERNVAEATLAVTHKDGEIRALEGVDYQAGIASWEAQRQNEVANYEAVLKGLQERAASLGNPAAVVKHLEAQVAQMAAVQVAAPPITVPGLEEAQTMRVVANGALNAAQTVMRRLDAELAQIQAAGEGRCPRCGSQVTGDHLRMETQRIEAERVAAAEDLQTATLSVREAQELVDALQRDLTKLAATHQQQAQQHAQQLAAVQSDLTQARATERELLELADRIQKGQAMIAAKLAEVNPVVAQAKEKEARLNQLKREWRQAQSWLVEQETALAYAQFWVDAAGARGLKSYILDSKLQEMTDATNEWVRLLTGGTFWVRFESQKLGRSSKTLRNAPSIRVFKYQPDGRISERSYRGWSGGEKRRVSWCIDFGLSRLVARRARKRWDLLILDEVFKFVDQAGGEAVVEMLTELQREKSSIFVVEHDGEFQAHFETVETVVKERGRSRVVGANDAGERQEAVQPGRVVKKRKRKPPKRIAATSVQDRTAVGPGHADTAQPQAQPKTKVQRRRIPRRAVVQ